MACLSLVWCRPARDLFYELKDLFGCPFFSVISSHTLYTLEHKSKYIIDIKIRSKYFKIKREYFSDLRCFFGRCKFDRCGSSIQLWAMPEAALSIPLKLSSLLLGMGWCTCTNTLLLCFEYSTLMLFHLQSSCDPTFFKQGQMNLDLWPREKTIQVQSNRYFAIKEH